MTDCTVCAKPLGPMNRSGLCRPHFVAKLNNDPDILVKRAEGNRRHALTPEGIYTRKQAARVGIQTRMSAPGWLEKAADNMRRNVQPKSITPEALARRDNVAKGITQSETLMGWCPREYRQAYHDMKRRNPRMKAVDARKIILDRAKADEANRCPFERQLEKVRNGAGLVTVRPVRKPDPQGTLGGVASGMLG